MTKYQLLENFTIYLTIKSSCDSFVTYKLEIIVGNFAERELTSIIIGDPDILKPSVLTSAKEAFCDATFYVAPSPCPQDKESQMRQRNFQLLNIAYQDHGHLVPLFHAVMNSRRYHFDIYVLILSLSINFLVDQNKSKPIYLH